MEQYKNGGEKKVEEYINRIKNGESKEFIFKDLSPIFVDAIERGLENNLEYQERVNKNKEIDSEKIKDIRIELGLEENNEEKENKIESYNISLPNLDEIIKNGGGQLEVFSNNKKIEFDKFVVTVDGDSAEVMFVQKKDRTQNKGIGVPIYIELGKRLSEKGITLWSSRAQYGPGNNLWLKLSQLGFTERVNGGFIFKNKEKDVNKIEIGGSVKYQGRNWKVKDIIDHKFEINGKIEIRSMYNLERDDGYILQEGGVKKYIFKEDFGLNN